MSFPRVDQIKLEARQIGSIYLIVIAVFVLGMLVGEIVDGFGGIYFEPRVEAVSSYDPHFSY